MKIVVTGALGHIGSQLVRKLPEFYPQTRIIMIDNMLTQRYCSLFNLPKDGKYSFIEGDVLSLDLNSVFKGAHAVVHLAAITDAASSFENKAQVEHVNYNATVKVAKACMYTDCSMIHISSTSVYGTQEEVVDENCTPAELKPQSPYAETKLKEERYLRDAGANGELKFITCRFGTICGISPGMRFHTAVNKFCWQAVIGQPLTVWQTAFHQKRPYLTLCDAVNAIGFIIKKNLFDQSVYNVLTENLTVNAIADIIKHHVPDLSIQFVDSKIMNQLSYEVLNHQFKSMGFEITGSIDKSISETIKLLKNAGGK